MVCPLFVSAGGPTKICRPLGNPKYALVAWVRNKLKSWERSKKWCYNMMLWHDIILWHDVMTWWHDAMVWWYELWHEAIHDIRCSDMMQWHYVMTWWHNALWHYDKNYDNMIWHEALYIYVLSSNVLTFIHDAMMWRHTTSRIYFFLDALGSI